MTAETTGGLIRMTAHMVVRAGALRMIWFGAIAAALFGFLAMCAATSKRGGHKWRYVALFVAVALVGAGIMWAGAKQPRRKEIYCCACGPVSLEQVAAVYEIIEVDGAFLILAER